jgi:UDP-2-acetamido-3-amino-2,3-dideoxy-glucuronate N-acetyltransferase
MTENLHYPLDYQCLVDPKLTMFRNTHVGEGVRIMPFCNVYDSNLAEQVFIGPFCEIGGTVIGRNSRISSHCYLCPGVNIGEDTFLAHGVMTTNDLFDDVPEYEKLEDLRGQWKQQVTIIGNRVRVGSGAVLLPVRIGDGSIIGAGCVVLKDVAPGDIVVGNPARVIGNVDPTKF